MKNVNKFLMAGVCAMCAVGANAAGMTSTANVNVTSDTAATAKNMAMDEARRQIIIDVLGPYADRTALRSAVAHDKASSLTNLIASSEISGERTSNTTYSAKIKMTVDRVAAKQWMAEHEIQNWLNLAEDTGNVFSVVLDLNNRVSDWAAVRKIASEAGVNLDTQSINENKILFLVNASKRGTFTIALREKGWQYRDIDGVLHIFK